MNTRHDIIHMELCRYVAYKYPKALFHSDMSGVRLTKKQAGHAKRMRKKRGHPDWILYEPRGGFVGLMIEIKPEQETIWKLDGSLRKSEHLAEQAEYGKDLRMRGWCFMFAVGLDEAIRKVDSYMKGKSDAVIKMVPIPI
jgi:hypothetical protein